MSLEDGEGDSERGDEKQPKFNHKDFKEPSEDNVSPATEKLITFVKEPFRVESQPFVEDTSSGLQSSISLGDDEKPDAKETPFETSPFQAPVKRTSKKDQLDSEPRALIPKVHSSIPVDSFQEPRVIDSPVEKTPEKVSLKMPSSTLDGSEMQVTVPGYDDEQERAVVSPLEQPTPSDFDVCDEDVSTKEPPAAVPKSEMPEIHFAIPVNGSIEPHSGLPQVEPISQDVPDSSSPKEPSPTLRPTPEIPEMQLNIPVNGYREPSKIIIPVEQTPEDISEEGSREETFSPAAQFEPEMQEIQFEIPENGNAGLQKIIQPVEQILLDISEKGSPEEKFPSAVKPIQKMPEIQFVIPVTKDEEPRTDIQPSEQTPKDIRDKSYHKEASPAGQTTPEVQFTIPFSERDRPGKVILYSNSRGRSDKISSDQSQIPETRISILGVDGRTPLVEESSVQRSEEATALRDTFEKVPSFTGSEPQGPKATNRDSDDLKEKPSPIQVPVETTPEFKIREIQFALPNGDREGSTAPLMRHPQEEPLLINGAPASKKDQQRGVDEVHYRIPMETSPDTIQSPSEDLPPGVTKVPFTFSEIDVAIPLDDNQAPVKVVQKPLEPFG